jgi:hypothetical protein
MKQLNRKFKRLWDQGYDRDELDQKAAQEAQGGGFGRGGGGGFW